MRHPSTVNALQKERGFPFLCLPHPCTVPRLWRSQSLKWILAPQLSASAHGCSSRANISETSRESLKNWDRSLSFQVLY